MTTIHPYEHILEIRLKRVHSNRQQEIHTNKMYSNQISRLVFDKLSLPNDVLTIIQSFLYLKHVKTNRQRHLKDTINYIFKHFRCRDDFWDSFENVFLFVEINQQYVFYNLSGDFNHLDNYALLYDSIIGYEVFENESRRSICRQFCERCGNYKQKLFENLKRYHCCCHLKRHHTLCF